VLFGLGGGRRTTGNGEVAKSREREVVGQVPGPVYKDGFVQLRAAVLA
jgi:hypothetical protein